jgi:hypothetical protein
MSSLLDLSLTHLRLSSQGPSSEAISTISALQLTTDTSGMFTLSTEDDFDRYSGENIHLPISPLLSTQEEACDPTSLPHISSCLATNTFPWGSGLNPFRQPHLLCQDIYDLLTSQMKLISLDSPALALCESICKSIVMNTLVTKQGMTANTLVTLTGGAGSGGLTTGFESGGLNLGGKTSIDIKYDLWEQYDGNSSQQLNGGAGGGSLDEERNRGRSLSPTNRRSRSHGRQSNSTGRKSRTIDSNSPVPKDGRNDETTDPLAETPTPMANGGVAAASNDRRSRSYSSGPQRSNQHRGLSASKLPPKSTPNSKSSNNGSGSASASNSGGGPKQSSSSVIPSSAHHPRAPPPPPSMFGTLKCFPSEINKYIHGKRGPIHGIWITDHPLSSLPASYFETVSLIDSYPTTVLNDSKRAEWEMDLLREYDEKRMDRLEEYLISCRKNIEDQMKHSSSRREEKSLGKKSSSEAKK